MATKKKLIFYLVISLIFLPLVYAGNYGAGTYGAGIYGIGEASPVTPAPTPTPSSSSGGASCNYNWQCTDWFPPICPESGMRERICMNGGTCTGIMGMPELKKTCIYEHKEPLFDIFLTLPDKYKEICSGNKIKANVKLENYGKIELLDAFMTYWIVNENSKLIAELKDTRAVEDKTNFNIEMQIPKSTSKGTYRLYAQIEYNRNKTAVTGESFEILSEENCEFPFQLGSYGIYVLYGIVGIIILLSVFVLIKIFRKRVKVKEKKAGDIKSSAEYKRKIKENLKRIRNYSFLIIIFSFLVAGILLIKKSNMTGFVISGTVTKNNILSAVVFIFIIGISGLIVLAHKKKIIEKIENKKPKIRLIRKTRFIGKYIRLSSLAEKKVYSSYGNSIGYVEKAILCENRVYGWVIKVDKKYNFNGKILVKHMDVDAIKDIFIVDERIEDYLKQPKNLQPHNFTSEVEIST